MRLIKIVQEMDINGLASPQMTGDWEYKLHQMEQGQLARDAFMQEIKNYTTEIVDKAKSLASELKSRTFPDLNAPCPKCGATKLKQTDATYECTEPECGFRSKKYIASRLISEEEARQLFTTKFVGPLTGFRSRFNKPFDAALELDAKFKLNFIFDGDDKDSFDELTDDQVIANVERDGKELKVYATEKAYLVPGIKTKNDPDGFRLGKTILQREIEEAQTLKLLKDGKTDLIKGFISNKTKRPFDAFLILDPKTGKIGFEFPPREPRAKKKA
jgi:DNA topoisomerase-3